MALGEDFPHTGADPKLRSHLVLLPLIAHLARRNRIVLLAHFEMLGEFWGSPGTQDSRGRFLGAPIERAPGPLQYSRIIVGGRATAKEHRLQFFDRLQNHRFLELQRVTGANNPGPRRSNQLADAFHIWTAEQAGMDYFLTTDLKLVNSAAVNRPEKPKIPVIAPLELAARLGQDRVLRFRDVISWVVHRPKTKGRGPLDHPQEQLLEMSRALASKDRRKTQ